MQTMMNHFITSFVVIVIISSISSEPETAVTPTATIQPAQLRTPEGKDVVLTCTVTGNPDPRVTWSKSGYMERDLQDNVQRNGDVLRINAATLADSGVYICRAENEAGIDVAFSVVGVEPSTENAE